MRFFFTLILMVSFFVNFAQNDSIKKVKIDSVRINLKADSIKIYRFNIFRPYANIDNRNSFIQKKPVNVKGGQIGIIINEYHVFGFGYYTITQQSQRAQKNTENTINQYLTLNYATLFYQYVMVDKRFFEIDLPFEIGYGKYNLKFEDIASQKVYRNVTQPMVPLGAGVQLVLKPMRWIGFSTMGGYRFVDVKNTNLNFSGLYYSFGLWLDVRQAYRDIRYYGFTKRRYKEALKEINKM